MQRSRCGAPFFCWLRRNWRNHDGHRWKAVTRGRVDAAAQSVLHQVIRTNAVTFGDDLRFAWHQSFTDRTVIEIRPEGRSLPPFRDYLRVNLSFKELAALCSGPHAHRDWVAALRAVGAIYLIVNTQSGEQSGEQYVGSATGTGGLRQRCCEYAVRNG